MAEHKARKRFGQNFLQDTRIINDIVEAVRPQPDDVVIEIGLVWPRLPSLWPAI